ncbi:hypothetical protein L3Q67_02040 [Saccharothrix sp. AJ9571]|nr:hypothetical protein L3Q67_32915 [Saccharothrix sp. AJ9571]UJW32594.1 hypothetical protein L3Q67_02040 [Saccharothrix sp. AJ9571]
MTAARTSRGEPGPARWGEYAAAVHRWELLLRRPAPHPTQPGRHGRPVLAPVFVEWLMGLPPGWVTAEHLGLPRTAQLRALGNGVMPAQAAYALSLLLDDVAHLHHVSCHAPVDPRHAPARRATSTRRREPGRSRRSGTRSVG